MTVYSADDWKEDDASWFLVRDRLKIGVGKSIPHESWIECGNDRLRLPTYQTDVVAKMATAGFAHCFVLDEVFDAADRERQARARVGRPVWGRFEHFLAWYFDDEASNTVWFDGHRMQHRTGVPTLEIPDVWTSEWTDRLCASLTRIPDNVEDTWWDSAKILQDFLAEKC